MLKISGINSSVPITNLGLIGPIIIKKMGEEGVSIVQPMDLMQKKRGYYTPKRASKLWPPFGALTMVAHDPPRKQVDFPFY